jgi:negative regulator of replication initiation
MDETLNERLPYASRSVATLSAIAIHGCNVDLDTTTQYRWQAALQAMRVTDSYADQTDDSERIIHLLDTLATFDDTFPNLSAEELGSRRYSHLIRGAATIIKHGEQLRLADSPEDYIAVRAREARVTASVVTNLATDYVAAQPNYLATFAPSVVRLTTAAGFVDTAIDAARDHQAGVLAFPPSLAFRAQLLQKGIAELLPLAPLLAHPKIVKAFGMLAINAIKSERLKRQ